MEPLVHAGHVTRPGYCMGLLWMTVRSSYILVCNCRHAKWANLSGNNPVPQSSMDAAFIKGALRGAGGTSKRAITDCDSQWWLWMSSARRPVASIMQVSHVHEQLRDLCAPCVL